MSNEALTTATLASVPVLSFGQNAVGLDFNPSGNPDVVFIKTKFAELIDLLDQRRNPRSLGANYEDASPETKRLCSVAITEAQTAQMWAVKAVTNK